MDYQYTIVNRLVRNHTHINIIKDLPRSGRPHVTSQHEDRALHRLVSHSQPALFWKTNGYQIMRNHLKSAGLKSRRVIKRPMLSGRHQPLRLAWWLARCCLNLRTWRRIHWSDESSFCFIKPMDKCDFGDRPYSGDSVMIWGVSLMIASWTWSPYEETGDQYIRDVLQPLVVHHFDNHPIAARTMFMDDNARPHRSMAVTAYLQSEAVTSLPWPAMSPDLNPIRACLGHARPSCTGIWTYCTDLLQLEAALHRYGRQHFCWCFCKATVMS